MNSNVDYATFKRASISVILTTKHSSVAWSGYGHSMVFRKVNTLINFGAGSQIGDVSIGDLAGRDVTKGQLDIGSDAKINGVAVGLNLGTIVYGRMPQEEERRRLVRYLGRLAAKLRRLPLRGLDPKLEDHHKGPELHRVYTMLATQSSRREVAHGSTLSLCNFFEENNPANGLCKIYDPDWALPDKAVHIVGVTCDELGRAHASELYGNSETLPDEIMLIRPALVTEVVAEHRRLVVLGDPGSGKSTFLRHLAWTFAQQGLDQKEDLADIFGWSEEHTFLPIYISLRKIAGRLAQEGMHETVVYRSLLDEVYNLVEGGLEDLVSESLFRGAALLMFDGLDEVPVEAIPGVTVGRQSILQVLRAFVEIHARVRCVITCRTRAFDERLRAIIDWPTEIIASFSLGQIRSFVTGWYEELGALGQLDQGQQQRLQDELIRTISSSAKLRSMAKTPLMLIMMALVIYHDGILPRDRPLLYERLLELLLGQWDKIKDGQSLSEAIGLPDWSSERLRPLLDQLSYQAHALGTSKDGRGRLSRSTVRDGLISFFEIAGVSEPWGAARRCLDYFEQRSGLLVPDGSDSYVFSHLTLQEHCAGRYILLSPEATDLVLKHRVDDRWREPIFLGLGAIQNMNPALLDRVLSDLIDEYEGNNRKPEDRRQRDLILAAEIGEDRDWSYLRTQRVNVVRLQRDLRRGLVELLSDRAQSLETSARIRAGFLLGDLGDPRFPVSIEDWCREIARAKAGDTSGYFCPVAPGQYLIGSTDEDINARDDEKPQHKIEINQPFWIGRFSITNEQWAFWESEGGSESTTANDEDLNGPNQPIVGLNIEQVEQFCAWLSQKVGASIQLVHEVEWEAAARGMGGCLYPWGNSWRDDHAATEEDKNTRGHQYAVPVGCYPAGASPCGALDMAGNVWDMTSDTWHSYPGFSRPFDIAMLRVSRGGSFWCDKVWTRCAMRSRRKQDTSDVGFRVVFTLGETIQ
ncbi:MAG: SUMF1/EgtB/PvdO family nonheme iron enzyme [Chloroflexales bacterium]